MLSSYILEESLSVQDKVIYVQTINLVSRRKVLGSLATCEWLLIARVCGLLLLSKYVYYCEISIIICYILAMMDLWVMMCVKESRTAHDGQKI